MNNSKINIVIVENSQIITCGVEFILLNSTINCSLTKFTTINDFLNSNNLDIIDIAIINPFLIQNLSKEIVLIKNKYSKIVWIALQYQIFDNQTLFLFDNKIQITDSSQHIINIISTYSDNEKRKFESLEHEQLSEREIDVLKLVTTGYSNKEIADNLNISIHTVVSHRKNITQKTGIKSQAGLTIYAISKKIIEIDNKVL